MKVFGKRVVYKKTLNKIIKEKKKNSYKKVKQSDFDYLFFQKNEFKFVRERYLTIYENTKGQQYCVFTNHLPQPKQEIYDNIDDLIGKETGYNTKIVSIEKCYVIG